MAATCTPPLCAKADLPTKGKCSSGVRLATSITKCDRSDRRARFPVGRHWSPILSSKSGTIEHRLALPQRSPTPLMVPCTWMAPSRTPTSELTTAHSESLWVWIPNGCARAGLSSQMIRSRSQGRVPPLVSHSTTVSAPPRMAACNVSNA